MDFTVPAYHGVKLKESQKKDEYVNLSRYMKKKKQQLWNMKVTVIPIVIGALGTVTKGLVSELEDIEIRGRGVTMQSTALLKSARVRRSVQET